MAVPGGELGLLRAKVTLRAGAESTAVALLEGQGNSPMEVPDPGLCLRISVAGAANGHAAPWQGGSKLYA